MGKITQFNKDHAAMKSYLLGRNYKTALRVLAFASSYHIGFRKDKETPEFQHQLRIAFAIMNLRDVVNEELCICLAFLHDTPEDYSVPYTLLSSKFGEEIARKSYILDKNQYKSSTDCFLSIENDIDCSIVKGADNCDNINSMVGVFSESKIQSYITRTETEILPMLKNAAYNFPEQHFAYAALRSRLKDQIIIYKHYNSEVSHETR
jgi:(p)ppGpp synthase/HD superfamily hydrolase